MRQRAVVVTALPLLVAASACSIRRAPAARAAAETGGVDTPQPTEHRLDDDAERRNKAGREASPRRRLVVSGPRLQRLRRGEPGQVG